MWCADCSAGWTRCAGSSSSRTCEIFFRDSTQWSQLILVGVLVMVILFNIQALPLDQRRDRCRSALITLIAFLNQGLTGFVIAAVAARFIFPSISLEGRLLWLLRSSPLDPRAMLRSKYLVGVVPLVALAIGADGHHQCPAAGVRTS